MKTFELQRIYLPTETVGSFLEDGLCLAKTLELPWKNNAKGISCIPEGIHTVVKEATSTKHEYPHFRILNVKGRNGILMHRITYVKDLRGCIGVGKAFADLNKDGVPDIVQSTIALQELYDTLPGQFQLIILPKKI